MAALVLNHLAGEPAKGPGLYIHNGSGAEMLR